MSKIIKASVNEEPYIIEAPPPPPKGEGTKKKGAGDEHLSAEETMGVISSLQHKKEALEAEIATMRGAAAAAMAEEKAAAEKEIAEAKAEADAMTARWKNEKAVLEDVKRMRADLDAARLKYEQAASSGDVAEASRIKYGVIPDLEKKLKAHEEDIIADIQGGMLEDGETVEVMESTAKSSDDYFHDVWVESEGGEGGYTPVFVPSRDVIHDAKPIDDTREFIEWLYVHRNDETRSGRWRDPGKYYWWLWEIGSPLEHINWYRYRRLRTSFAKMCNEAPETPEQAFITAGQKVFDAFELARKREKCRAPLYVGDLISDAEKGREVLNGITFVPNADGKLRIWEKPDDSPIANRYVVCVDIGGPNDTSDYSSVRVLDRLMLMPEFGGLNGRPNIVAEMHYHVDHDRLAYDAMRLAEWYGHAKLIFESNTLETKDKDYNADEEGFEYILDIVAKMYDNLYMRNADEADIDNEVVRRWGFHTNVNTKPKIIDNMKIALRDDLWDEPSTTCIDEMSIYVDIKGKYTAPPKKHDDVLMCTAILLWVASHEMPQPSWILPEKEGLAEEIVGDRDGLARM